jgi:hypothetical protein
MPQQFVAHSYLDNQLVSHFLIKMLIDTDSYIKLKSNS